MSQFSALLKRRGLALRFSGPGRLQLVIWLFVWLLGAWLIQLVLDLLGFATFGMNAQKGYEIASLAIMFLLQLWAIISGGQLIEDDARGGKLDWLFAKPLPLSTYVSATYMAEVIWLGTISLGIGLVSFALARLAGLAAMQLSEAVIFFTVACLGLSFWTVLTSTLSLVLRSVRAGTFTAFIVLAVSLTTQNPPIWAQWLKLSPTHLMGWLESIMLKTPDPGTLLLPSVLTLLAIIILGGISVTSLRRRFIQ